MSDQKIDSDDLGEKLEEIATRMATDLAAGYTPDKDQAAVLRALVSYYISTRRAKHGKKSEGDGNDFAAVRARLNGTHAEPDEPTAD